MLGPNAVHNMVINQWFTAGILGLIGIIVIIYGVVLTAARLIRSSTQEVRTLSTALLASVVAFLVFGMGEPILFVRYGWFPAALLVALHAQRRRAEVTVSVRAAGSSRGERCAHPVGDAAVRLAVPHLGFRAEREERSPEEAWRIALVQHAEQVQAPREREVRRLRLERDDDCLHAVALELPTQLPRRVAAVKGREDVLVLSARLHAREDLRVEPVRG